MPQFPKYDATKPMKSKIQPCIMPPYDVTKSSSLWISFVKEKIQELLDLTTSTKCNSCVVYCITHVKPFRDHGHWFTHPHNVENYDASQPMKLLFLMKLGLHKNI